MTPIPTAPEITALLTYADELAAETGATRDRVLAVLLWQAQRLTGHGFGRLQPMHDVRPAKTHLPAIDEIPGERSA